MSRKLSGLAVLNGMIIIYSSGCALSINSDSSGAQAIALSKIGSSQVAGSEFSVTITAKKEVGSTVSDYAGTVQITSSDAAATLPSAHTFVISDQGSYTFKGIKLNTKGNQTLTFSDGSVTAKSETIAVLHSCAPGKQVFTYTGGPAEFTPPSGCSSVNVKMWGAGGGGSRSGYGPQAASGGGGGYVAATLAIDPSQTYTLIVGGGAAVGTYVNNGTGAAAAGGYGGGGAGFNIYEYTGAGGGGRSAVRLGSTELLTAAGGGGAGSSYSYVHNGGAGGSTAGVAGDGVGSSGGGGGTQSSGGSGGSDGGFGPGPGGSGSQFLGGNGNTNNGTGRGAGGGGGGYYGGGGGTTPENLRGGAGGGGSSYIGGDGVSNASMTAGSGATTGNSSDFDCTAAGTGGGTNSAGSNGRIVVYYGALQVWSISPSSGAASGGGTATLTGQGFDSGTTVKIGGAPCTDVNIASSTQLTCTIPSGSVGPADVVVSGSFVQDATLSGEYTFN